MIPKEELEKMTVAQIKEKLKSKRLPTSGAKSDLVNRLYESLMAEEKLLEGPGGDTEDPDVDLSNVDEVLGLDDEKDSAVSSASELKPSDSLLSLGSPINESMGDKSLNTTAESKAKSVSPVKKQHPPVTATAPKPTIQAEPKPAVTATAQPATDEEAVSPKRQPATDEEKKVQIKMAARLGVPLSESEAKAKRSARFGGAATTEQQQQNNEEEMKAKRAARFGIVAEEQQQAKEELGKRKSASEEDGKMLKRAERFGLPLKRGANSDGSANGGGGGVSDGDNSEVLQKRARRFGISMEAAGDQESKKVERAKRFGLAS